MATAGALRPGDRRGDRGARRFGALAWVRQRGARHAHHARAGCEHDHRAGLGPACRDPGAVGPLHLLLVPDGHGGAATGRRRSISSGDPLAPGGIRTDTWRAGFDALWEIDLFGSLRNEFHAIDRRTERDVAALGAAQLSIVAETAQAWFSMIGARERLALRRQQLANQEENIRILTARVNAGGSSGLDLAQAEAQRRGVAASLPLAEADLVREEQRLAVLTAWPIETLRANTSPATTIPGMPEIVATGTPEEWMRRRPDIRSAERELAATYADVGDEVAEYLPESHAARQLRLDERRPRRDRRAGVRALVLRAVDHLELPRLRPRAPARESRGSAARRRHRRLPGNRPGGARGNGKRPRRLPGREPGRRRTAPRPRSRDGGVASGAPALRGWCRRLPRRAGRRSAEARFRGPARPVRVAARNGPGRALQGSRRRSLKRAQDPPRGQRREQVLQRVTAKAGRREERHIEVLGELGEDIGAEGHPQPA